MKPLIRMTVMLLVACSLQNCQDLAFQSVESGINAQVKASKQIKSHKDKHAFTISAITHDYNLPYHQFLVGLVGTGSIAVDWGDGTSTTYEPGYY